MNGMGKKDLVLMLLSSVFLIAPYVASAGDKKPKLSDVFVPVLYKVVGYPLKRDPILQQTYADRLDHSIKNYPHPGTLQFRSNDNNDYLVLTPDKTDQPFICVIDRKKCLRTRYSVPSSGKNEYTINHRIMFSYHSDNSRRVDIAWFNTARLSHPEGKTDGKDVLTIGPCEPADFEYCESDDCSKSKIECIDKEHRKKNV